MLTWSSNLISFISKAGYSVGKLHCCCDIHWQVNTYMPFTINIYHQITSRCYYSVDLTTNKELYIYTYIYICFYYIVINIFLLISTENNPCICTLSKNTDKMYIALVQIWIFEEVQYSI